MLTFPSNRVAKAIEHLLGRPPEQIKRVVGGANNAVIHVLAGHDSYVAKVYFAHHRDERDRLATEFGMLSFLWQHGVRCIPEPVAADTTHRIGLYRFVEGWPLKCHEIGWPEVERLIGFLDEMWKLGRVPKSRSLPAASDSAFSFRDHLRRVWARLDRMRTALRKDRSAVMALRFIDGEVAPTLERIEKWMRQEAAKARIPVMQRLPRRAWALSPADHGFHNALRTGDGALVFLDFEYAGWDDPAQMISNALHQPAVPIPDQYRLAFAEEMCRRLRELPWLPARLRILHPLLGVKWVLIMLNEFMPVARMRRRFANRNPVADRFKQLDKARKKLYQVTVSLASGDEGRSRD